MRALLGREGVDAMAHDARVAWDGLSPAQSVPFDHAAHRGDLRAAGRRPDARIRSSSRRFDAAMEVARRPVRGDDPRRAVRRRDRSERLEGGRAARRTAPARWSRVRARRLLDERARVRGRRRGSKSIAATPTPPVRDVARTARLRPLLTYALPVMSAQALIELAHVYVGLGEVARRRVRCCGRRTTSSGNDPASATSRIACTTSRAPCWNAARR